MAKDIRYENLRSFWKICIELGLFNGRLVLALSLLMLLMTFFEGLGVALLLPVLELLGSGGSYESMAADSKVWAAIVKVFSFAGMDTDITTILILIFFTAVFKQLLESLVTFIISKRQYTTVAKMRSLYFNRVMSTEKNFIDEMTTGHFVDTAMNLGNSTGAFLQMQFKQISSYLTIFMYLCALLFVAPKTTFFLICYGGILVAVVRGFNRRISDLSVQNISFNKKATEALINYFNCWRALKFSGLLTVHQKKFDDMLSHWSRNSQSIIMQGVYSRLITNPLSALAICLILFLSLQSKSLQIVDITFFCIAFIRITPMYKSVISSRQSIFALIEKIKSFHKQLERANRKIELDNGTNRAPSKLCKVIIKNLSFSYSDEHSLLFDKFSEKIPIGKITAIVGRSGSGKSTFVDLFTRLIRPANNAFEINGTCINDIILSDFRCSFYYMSQNMPVFGDSIRGCLSSGIDGVSEVNMVSALRLAELTEFIDDRGSLINVPLQENATNLSGGQKQRLNLARSFLSKSQFIILDEPTSNLDLKHSKNIFKNIKKYNREGHSTIIIISHDLRSRDYVDHIIDLNER